MNRRDFLKTIGLGGVALTLPKPLEVVAAKMADLEAPPLHVGRADLSLRANDDRFLIDRFMFQVDRTISRVSFEDFARNWTLRVARKTGDVLEDLLRVRVSMVPFGPGVDPELGWAGALVSASSYPYVMLRGQTWEFWLTPDGPARFPMPKVYMVVNGTLFEQRPDPFGLRGGRPEAGCSFISIPFRTVRVERAAAIRMGLVGPEEPEEDFAVSRREETVDWDKEGFPDDVDEGNEPWDERRIEAK